MKVLRMDLVYRNAGNGSASLKATFPEEDVYLTPLSTLMITTSMEADRKKSPIASPRASLISSESCHLNSEAPQEPTNMACEQK